MPTGLRWLNLEKFNPDVIHVHTFFGIGLEAVISGRVIKKPIIGTNHMSISEFACYYPGFCEDWLKENSLKYVVWFYNQCNFVTAPAKFLLAEMVKDGLTKPYQTVSNPVDMTVFGRKYRKETAKKHFKLSAHTIVYAGRLAQEKNIDVIIRAVALIKQRISDINFVLAGHGSYQGKLKEIVKDLHLENEVRFLGTFSHKDLAKLYCASDIFVITSTSEVQSMVLMQAMACGLPAIGVNWRTMPELINEKNGLLVEPGNYKKLAEKIVNYPAAETAGR